MLLLSSEVDHFSKVVKFVYIVKWRIQVSYVHYSIVIVDINSEIWTR